MDRTGTAGTARRAAAMAHGVAVGAGAALVAALVLVLGGASASAAGASPATGRPTTRAAYAWPVTSTPVVVRPFRAPTHRFGPGHRGADLGAAPGAAVLAAAAGVVVFAGVLAGRGVVSVQHPDGLRTTYEPVTPRVTPGAQVVRGTVLGTLAPGHAGCPTACLHWGARRDRTTYVDPLVLVAPPRVRLLPVPDPWPDGPAPAATVSGGGTGTRRPANGPVTPGDGPGRGPPSAARP